jgi:hypothetical protein
MPICLLPHRFAAAAVMSVRSRSISMTSYGKWRQELTKGGHVPLMKKIMMKGMAFVLGRPALYRFGGASGPMGIEVYALYGEV